MSWFGYQGKILRINLSNRRIDVEELNKNDAIRFIGGSGLGAKILYEETKKNTEPLGPDNILIFATGPLTGTKILNSGRFSAVTKSPLTGIFSEASAGGYWGSKLKQCGYDVLIVEGKADKPIYINISDDKVELKNASHLWGKDTIESTDCLLKKHGDASKAAVIGRAGERLVNIANIVTDGAHGRVLGRCGMGAVMGSKNIKAIVVGGTQQVKVFNQDKLTLLLREIGPQMRIGPDPLRQHGTAVQLENYNEIGELPIKNWYQGKWTKGAQKINGKVLTKELLVRRYHCDHCAIGCGRVVKAQKGKYEGRMIAGPEYETIAMLGSNCLIDDLNTIVKANELLNCYGLDSVSTGSAIAFGMEAYKRGIITNKDTEGLELTWGSKDALLEAIRMMGEREGIGELLGKGVRKAAQELGGVAHEFAVEVKGLEAPAHDPRAKFALALGYATSARGACHVSSFTMDFEEGITIDDLDLPPMPKRFTTENKAEGVIMMQNWMGIYDSSVLCKFGIFGGITPSIVARALSIVTGINIDKSELLAAGSRIYNMKRLYNCREGISRRDDTLPPRFLYERKGGGTDQLPPMDILLNEFYNLRGWDDSGIPKKENLKKLNLGEYAE